MKREKVAAYSGTKNYYEYMIPAVKSLMYNSDVDKIFLLIEDNEFPYELPDIVECLNVSKQRFFKKDGPNMKSSFTYMCLMKLTYSKLFPNLDRILSLDVDTIVDEDISDIWDLPLEGGSGTISYYFAGVREGGKSHDGYLYTNAGVWLMNLKALRETNKDQQMIDEINMKKYVFPEQDVMNKRCQGRILMIPSEYNSTIVTDKCDKPKIFHYACRRKWDHYEPYLKYKDIPWDEVRDKNKMLHERTKTSPQNFSREVRL